MGETIQVNLPDDMSHRLAREVQNSHTDPNHVIIDALQRYLAIREFRRIRAEMVPKARKAGFFTDEDIFEKLK